MVGKSAILFKAAAISSISSNVVANPSNTVTTSQSVNAAAVASPIVQLCRITPQHSSCDSPIIDKILYTRCGASSTDDAATAKSDSSRKQQRHSTTPNDIHDKSNKPSKSVPKPKKSTKSSSRIVSEILKETDYYKILGLVREEVKEQSKNIDSIIQKAYRKRALQTHPDKTGGDRRAFDKVAEAYDVLQDENKRNVYNKYGKGGLEGGLGSAGGGMNGGMAPEDLFRSFFGGPSSSAGPFGSFGQQQQQNTRNRSVRFQVDVSLEDIYVGKTMKVVLPGSQTPIDLTIPRGSYHNENIVASGVIDFDSNQPPGDAHFRIKVRPHSTFTNKGYDLAVQMEISLAEAITGVSRTIRHLDGRKIRIVSAAASRNPSSDIRTVGPNAIATGDVHILPGEGMPKNAMGTEFGDLFIQYQVNMPKSKGIHSKDHISALTEAERTELERLLYKLEGKSVGEKGKVHWPFQSYKDGKIMKLGSVSDFGKNGPRISEDHDDSSSPFGAFGDSSGFSPMGGHRGFFWSSTGTGGGRGSGESTNPFGQHMPSDEDATQCRQM